MRTSHVAAGIASILTAASLAAIPAAPRRQRRRPPATGALTAPVSDVRELPPDLKVSTKLARTARRTASGTSRRR